MYLLKKINVMFVKRRSNMSWISVHIYTYACIKDASISLIIVILHAESCPAAELKEPLQHTRNS